MCHPQPVRLEQREGGRGVQAMEKSLGLVSSSYVTCYWRGMGKHSCCGSTHALTSVGQRSSSRVSTWTEHLLCSPLSP